MYHLGAGPCNICGAWDEHLCGGPRPAVRLLCPDPGDLPQCDPCGIWEKDRCGVKPLAPCSQPNGTVTPAHEGGGILPAPPAWLPAPIRPYWTPLVLGGSALVVLWLMRGRR